MADPRSTGERGRAVEDRVCDFLRRRGLTIVERNVALAGAEIDIIAIDNGAPEPVHVFVEVRSRASDERGSPLETVDRRKQRQIIRAATAWLVAADLWERVAVRFDVVGVVGDKEPDFSWVPNAFEA